MASSVDLALAAQSGYIGGDSTNLIINYLPQGLSDDEFRNIFLSVGPVKSCRIIRDKASNYSYGFGFVDYHTEDDAKRAIQTLNGHQMQGKTLKVALARPGGEEIKGANLYIRNLPTDWSKQNLDDCFKTYGDIIQSRILIDHQTNASRRVGFVLFSKRSEAELAIASLNGKVPDGASDAIYIKFADDNNKKNQFNFNMQQFFQNPQAFMSFDPRNPTPSPYMGFNPTQNQTSPNNSFFNNNIPNLSNNVTGLSTGNNIPARYPGPGPMRNQQRFRYNPVASNQGPTASSNNTANALLSQAQQPGQNEEVTLYVYNIGMCNEKNLWDLFTPFGAVSKVAIVYDLPKGVSKGYAFVTMPNYSQAQNAIFRLNGCDLLGSGRPLQVSLKTQKAQKTDH